MAGKFTLNDQAILLRVMRGAAAEMQGVVSLAEDDAKARAPVRKQYHGRLRHKKLGAEQLSMYAAQLERAGIAGDRRALLMSGARRRSATQVNHGTGNSRVHFWHQNGRRMASIQRRGGFLRDHIRSEVSIDGTDIVGKLISGAAYSKYVEFPTSRTAAQPFLYPAWKTAQKRLRTRLHKRFEG